jgi:hypothetical protein
VSPFVIFRCKCTELQRTCWIQTALETCWIQTALETCWIHRQHLRLAGYTDSTWDLLDIQAALETCWIQTALETYWIQTELETYWIQTALEKQVRYSAAVRELEMAILEIKFDVRQLQESLDVTSLGQLSSVLINPCSLSIIVQQVSLQLPAGLSMLTGLTVEEMYVCVLYSSHGTCCCHLQEY